MSFLIYLSRKYVFFLQKFLIIYLSLMFFVCFFVVVFFGGGWKSANLRRLWRYQAGLIKSFLSLVFFYLFCYTLLDFCISYINELLCISKEKLCILDIWLYNYFLYCQITCINQKKREIRKVGSTVIIRVLEFYSDLPYLPTQPQSLEWAV